MEHLYNRVATPMNQFGRPHIQYRKRKQSICRIQAHSQATFHKQKSTITPGHPLSRYGINGLTKHAMKVCSLANPSEDCGSILLCHPIQQNPLVFKCRLHQLDLCSLHRSGQMFQSLLLWIKWYPPTPKLRVPLSQITSVASTLNTQTPSQA